MYKIFIFNRPLIIAATSEILSQRDSDELFDDGKKYLIFRHLGKKKNLLQLIDKFEKNLSIEQLIIHDSDIEKLWREFCSCYKIIEAAGGVVKNGDKTLVMFRYKTWDLPKGKIDKGETPEQAAVREITEETGIQAPTLGKKIVDTYHTYELNGKRILKKTYWFHMTTNQTALVPQTEENIEQIEWVQLNEFLQRENNIFPNLLEVFKAIRV
jgi:8-oxo-dGTP pyrophosphatase MutT (NUDIX family)